MRALGLAVLLLGVALGRAEACSRAFFIFFDDQQTGLSPRGAQVAQWFSEFFFDRHPWTPDNVRMSCGPVPPGDYVVLVQAHAQDSGGADPCTVSLRRGHAVRARLAMLGIPSEDVFVLAYGDRSPLVPTRPGTRDAQNRRVNLIILDRSAVDREDGLWAAARRDVTAACP